MTDLKSEFWSRMDKVHSGMLEVKGHNRLVPMSPQVDRDLPGHIWFITDKETELARSVADGSQPARFVLSDDSAGLYADIDGDLAASSSNGALDEVWNAMSAAWFEDGKADPDVRLLKFTPHDGEVSVTEASGPRILYEIAKANMSEQTPDIGAQGAVTFR